MVVVVDEFSLNKKKEEEEVVGLEEQITPEIGFVFRGLVVEVHLAWVWDDQWPPNGCGCQVELFLIREGY